MKWKKDQHSQKLNLGNGTIMATIQWVLDGNGYQAIVNGNDLGSFSSVDIAKSNIMTYIKNRITIMISEIEEMEKLR